MSKQTITVIKGDGIGPSIVEAAIQVLDKVGCDFDYEYVDAGLTALEKTGELLPQATLDAIARNKITLKGPLTTPVGEGFTSINVTLRKKFSLYSNVRPVISFKGTKARYENIDIITIRENTEGMYSGHGQVVSEDGMVAEATSIVTKEGAERIAVFAFETARRENRKKVTIVHQANILKSTSGLFLKVAREIYRNDPHWVCPLDKDIEAVFDPEKNEMIAEKHWWPQAELWIGMVNAWQISGDETYFKIFDISPFS